MNRRELMLLAFVTFLFVAVPQTVGAVSTFIPIGKGLTQFSGIAFDHLAIEQNQSVLIQYVFYVNSSAVTQFYKATPGFLTVTVTTPKGEQYTFSNIYHVTAWHYPEEFHGSTAEVGNYTVRVDMYGQVQQLGLNVRDTQIATFTVIPKHVLSPFVTPALSVLGLSIVALFGFGFLARLGVVSDRGLFHKIKSPFAHLGFLATAKVWVPGFLGAILASAAVSPVKVESVLVVGGLVVVAWAMQTVLTQAVYFGPLLTSYKRGTGILIFAYVSVALHEVSHLIFNLIGGMKIRQVIITPEEGKVIPDLSNLTYSFRTWVGIVMGGLAPAYFFPAILVFLWFAFSGVSLNLTFILPSVDIFTPFTLFLDAGSVNFFYWIVINLTNPLVYLFMYLFITASISAGPSLSDWAFAWAGLRGLPRYTAMAVLGILATACIVSIIDFNAIVSFFGFWFLVFLLVALAQFIALAFTRLSMTQGLVLLVALISISTLSGYVINSWAPVIQQLKCAMNQFYC